jgi:hypothetical protein
MSFHFFLKDGIKLKKSWYKSWHGLALANSCPFEEVNLIG